MNMANARAAKMSAEERKRYEEKWREDRKSTLSRAEKGKHREERNWYCGLGSCFS